MVIYEKTIIFLIQNRLVTTWKYLVLPGPVYR